MLTILEKFDLQHYKKLDFQIYGIEPKALKDNMQYSDKLSNSIFFLFN